jgi:hypothetical protein
MMALDPLNNLDVWPLKSIDHFLNECGRRTVREVFVTGSNTDPLLYRHTEALTSYLRQFGFIPGVRTNGIGDLAPLRCYAKGSLTVCSLDREINEAMMGGPPADVRAVQVALPDLKINIVLGPENRETARADCHRFAAIGITRVNLREPYGQPHVGNPINDLPVGYVYENPTYRIGGALVTYWDVHTTEVESVNLYASGRVSCDYPISRGHANDGEVHPQEHFEHGRHQEQWVPLTASDP